MSRRIRTTKQAREIRAGINARCLPYLTGGDPERGYYTTMDFRRVREHEQAIQFGVSKLTKAAIHRTPWWISTRDEFD